MSITKALCLGLCLSLGAASSMADAPDLKAHGHDLFHQYYKYWFNQNGTHCCNEQHCRPIQAGELRWHNGRWQINLNGWRTIAADRHVIDDGGLGPFGSICHQNDYILCVDMPDTSY